LRSASAAAEKLFLFDQHIQSRLKVSIRVAPKPAFLMCIGGWCQPMIEVELPYLLDFLTFYPLPPYTSDNDLLARLSQLWVTMADNQTIESMPNKLAIALK
jgi:hypothetical protein